MPILNRSGGVLLPVFSLPGKYGIGTFGQEARQFIELLIDMGFSYWQILPLCPVDECNSPYKSASAFAGNPLFIDLEILYSWGMLDEQDLSDSSDFIDPYQVQYQKVFTHRRRLFKKAYHKMTPKIRREMSDFVEAEAYWLKDYCLYTILSEWFKNKNWSQWPDPLIISRNSEKLKKLTTEYAQEIDYLSFLQFLFFKQWQDLKSYANKKGIKIIGDIPIYISFESADVWAHPEYFQLDQNFEPKNVAGVPPDYFSKTGQLWGNPLYNWEKLKLDNYSWWFDRLSKELNKYDLVRIDHFRAFSAYWSIPEQSESAISGEWIQGPGLEFFEAFQKKYDTSRIIAEDLGVQDEMLSKLLAQTQFPGMRIMNFAFIDQLDNIHLPHNYQKNMVAYTGTHDNNTLLGTLFDYTDEQRQYALSYAQYQGQSQDSWQEGGFNSGSCRALIETLWKSPAGLTLLPIQDLCGYGNDTVINKPGTTDMNWFFRITGQALQSIDHAWFRHLNQLYHRSQD